MGCNFSRRESQACDANIVPCARHPSQLYEAILEGFLLFLILLVLVRFGAFKRPGFLTGVFLIWYGLSRFLVEYFRVQTPNFFQVQTLWLCLYFWRLRANNGPGSFATDDLCWVAVAYHCNISRKI